MSENASTHHDELRRVGCGIGMSEVWVYEKGVIIRWMMQPFIIPRLLYIGPKARDDVMAFHSSFKVLVDFSLHYVIDLRHRP